ncbi:MAG TPA: calcium-binding protein [Verrucomicrobiales bacterium]|nr:calcium-binding protein [Verrucomicrobiales bacterium]HRJ11007.1 EF-hand domain-containing protein [Prosthecobacter sp.]HRK15702.1 EF-hand domain-containing protein [Prosthecobacter sp.]
MKIIASILTVIAFAGITLDASAQEKKKQDPEKVFAKKDANGDGKLSKEEFTKGAKDAAAAEKQFTARDKDKDGSVSKEEFMAAPKKKKDA